MKWSNISYLAAILVWNRNKCCTGVAMFSAVNPHEHDERWCIIFRRTKFCFMPKMPDAVFTNKFLQTNTEYKY